MGVPKLFRFLSERYPLINTSAHTQPTPVFDALYLDANGLIHPATHSNSDSLPREKDWKEVITSVFDYLEKLMRISKPRKLLYIAVDGPAPRAKMNQQRQRRFRSSRNVQKTLVRNLLSRAKQQKAEEEAANDESSTTTTTTTTNSETNNTTTSTTESSSVEQSKSKSSSNDSKKSLGDVLDSVLSTGGDSSGKSTSDLKPLTNEEIAKYLSIDLESDEFDPYSIVVDKEGVFDSNCITPGTLFLTNLSSALQAFIQYKIHSDPQWRALKIIFSGPDVAGEGEHKIMDFIRRSRTQPDYDPQTRHCIYGLDADLILLSLSLHEPYIALLREKVVFQNTIQGLDEVLKIQATDEFEYLHICLLRQYIEAEFRPVNPKQLDAPKPLQPEFAGVSSTKAVSIEYYRELKGSQQKPEAFAMPYSLERVINDVIFLISLIGNDFVPCIPGLDIDQDGLNNVFNAYKYLIPTWSTYLVDADAKTVNAANLESVLRAVENYLAVRWGEKSFKAMLKKEKETEREAAKAEEESKEAEAKEAEAPADNDKSSSTNNKTTTPTNNTNNTKTTATKKSPAATTPSSSSGGSKSWAQMAKSPTGQQAQSQESTKQEPSKPTPPAASPSSSSEKPAGPAKSKSWAQLASTKDKATPEAQQPTTKPSANEIKTQVLAEALGLEKTSSSQEGGASAKADATPASPTSPSSPTDSEPATPGAESTKREVTAEYIQAQSLEFIKAHYEKKFVAEDKADSKEGRAAIVKSYWEALNWILAYYFEGCVSWSWFYPYHSAPVIEDLVKLGDIPLKFELSQPFTPFEQLLAVLPPASAGLLPKALRSLMTESSSALASFYPTQYNFIKDEKHREWKNIALIPFIDAKVLKDAVEKVSKAGGFSEAEKPRNAFGSAWIWTAATEASKRTTLIEPLPVTFAASLPYFFSAERRRFEHPSYGAGPSTKPPVKRSSLHPGLTNVPHYSFPTTIYLGHALSLERGYVRVFGSASKSLSIVLKPLAPSLPPDSYLLATKILGTVVGVGWPYVGQAKITGLQDGYSDVAYYLSKSGKIGKSEIKGKFADTCSNLKRSFKERGISLGEVRIILEIKRVEGITRSPSGHYVKAFSAKTELYPMNLVARLAKGHPVLSDPRFQDKPAASVSERFPVGSSALSTSTGSFMIRGTVQSTDNNKGTVSLALDPYPSSDPFFAREIVADYKISYTQSGALSKTAGINASPLALSRLCSYVTVWHDDVKHQIGLGIKFERTNVQMQGYALRQPVATSGPDANRTLWAFSSEAISVIKEFYNTFPDVWAAIGANAKASSYGLADLFTTEELSNNPEGQLARFLELKAWLSENQPRAPLVSAGAEFLDEEAVRSIEESQSAWVANKLDSYLKKAEAMSKSSEVGTIIEVDADELISGNIDGSDIDTAIGSRVPGSLSTYIKTSNFTLGDRVVNISPTGSVPFGERGIIVGMDKAEAEVLFDRPFLSGTNFNGRITEMRGKHVRLATLLNYSKAWTNNPGLRKSGNDKKSKGGKDGKGSKDGKSGKGSKKVASNPFALLMDE